MNRPSIASAIPKWPTTNQKREKMTLSGKRREKNLWEKEREGEKCGGYKRRWWSRAGPSVAPCTRAAVAVVVVTWPPRPLASSSSIAAITPRAQSIYTVS